MYLRPTLVEYGRAEDLTLGGEGNDLDITFEHHQFLLDPTANCDNNPYRATICLG